MFIDVIHFFPLRRAGNPLLLIIWLCLFAAAPLNAQVTYTMGPGDEVRMTVFGQPNLTTEAQIGPDGSVQIPLLGTVFIANRSSSEAAQQIARAYELGNLLKQPQVNLLITEYRSKSVSILGKVNRPGTLILERPTSLTDALAWAGGVADSGSERLLLIRINADGKQTRTEYDLQKLLNHEAAKSTVVWMQNGDTIYVPIAGRFYLSGEVRAPGMYPLDRPLNVMQALGVGGGLTTRASSRSLKLFRPQANGSLKEIRAQPQDPVLDGDLLEVQESLF
jgi:polysaccharide export outer membrane protein